MIGALPPFPWQPAFLTNRDVSAAVNVARMVKVLVPRPERPLTVDLEPEVGGPATSDGTI